MSRTYGAEQNPGLLVHDDGGVDVHAFHLPYSALVSDEAKRDFVRRERSMGRVYGLVTPGMPESKFGELWDKEVWIPLLKEIRRTFPVNIEPEMIGGVQTDVVQPVQGVSDANRQRVLINLHGGGFSYGARYDGQIESTPIASIGRIKVITVDYREAPEFHFPAASEDVAKVYAELLKTYRPENIGIYGCSAGGSLTAQSVAWFQTHGLPKPGAIGIFGSGGSLSSKPGDSDHLNALARPSALGYQAKVKHTYFEGTDLDDPMVSPVNHPELLKEFPPTIFMTGTRDAAMSSAITTHIHLVEAGVDARLFVLEGATHCSFAQYIFSTDVPEQHEAWNIIVKFFDGHLGKQSK
ncbi:alpha/beta hydrolase [Bradyrhizobium iriomotense]|uniref:alpha/beta hydrolase n=1 Tax=Bradyrhizobium iriomotense TaxID=441950 RepID=UPI0024E07519|nr:alpha/beta hydrolase fold domain-containing protein [Bradyrhizobium iriomotense]